MILSSMVKKFLTAILLFALVLTNLFRPVSALAQSWWAPSYDDFNQKINNTAIPDNEIFGERYTHAQVWWVIYSIITFAISHQVASCAGSNTDGNAFLSCIGVPTCGAPGAPPPPGCVTADAGAPVNANSAGSSDLGFLEFARLADNMVVARPASGVSYVSYALDHAGISTANAQQDGFGFNTLSPVLGLWAASRNAAYSLMALAVILLAFMVMFRARISPQLSVSVMSAIPRIVIGFILITFSYAIAGFVIDMAYVVQGLIAAVVTQSNISDATAVGAFNMMNDIGGGLVNFGLAVVWIIFKGTYTNLIAVLFGGVSFLAATLVFILLLILIILAVVRIFWTFLRTYVTIILHVIALPFAALGYVASPSGNMFMQMIRSLAGNVSVFVTTSVGVMLAHMLLFSMGGGTGGGILSGVTFFNPYYIVSLAGGGLINLPGFNGMNPAILAVFIGTTVLLMIPSLANNIKSLIISGQMSRERSGMIGAGLFGMAIGSGSKAGMTGMGIAGVNMEKSGNKIVRFIGGQLVGASIRGGGLQQGSVGNSGTYRIPGGRKDKAF